MATTPTLPVDGSTTLNAALFAGYRTAILELQAGGQKMQLSVSQTGHGFAVGDVLRYGTASFAKARANLIANCIDTVGIVVAVADANTFTLHLGGYVTGLTGLVANTLYYLSTATAGLLTSTRPTSGYVLPVLKTENDASIGLLLLNSLDLAWGVVTKTSNYTLTETDVLVLADCTGGVVTLTLPTAASRAGWPPFQIKKTDSSGNALTIEGDGSETINGALNYAPANGEVVTLASDGSNWHII